MMNNDGCKTVRGADSLVSPSPFVSVECILTYVMYYTYIILHFFTKFNITT